MASKFGTWWQQIRRRRVAIVIVGVILGVVTISTIAVRRFGWDWIGFTSATGPILKPNEQYRPAKTLWDWSQLLLAPLLLALAALWFNLATTQRHKQDQEIALEKQREDLLQTYLDRMSELLLKEGPRSPEDDAELRNVARVRTITLLFQLDARRIGYVFAFLRKSGLMSTRPNGSIVSLAQADLKKINLSQANLYQADLSGADLLSADLSGADLSGANFRRAHLSDAHLRRADLTLADLSGANLFGADLSGADLSQADLRNAHLRNAHLSGADLTQANLSGADLSQADLRNAHLRNAHLSGADLTQADLTGATGMTRGELVKQASSLQGATMPDGSTHP